VRIVGWYTSPSWVPPVRRVAPSDTASFTRSSTSFTAASVISGPMFVLGSSGVTGHERLRPLDELADELVVDSARNDDLAGVKADLSLVEERPERRHPHRVVDVDVIEE